MDIDTVVDTAPITLVCDQRVNRLRGRNGRIVPALKLNGRMENGKSRRTIIPLKKDGDM